MGLAKYHAKRKFDQTPEPDGTSGVSDSEALHFVVQKHNASHLHYDFRLELDGVLKSWAIPKGPSLNPIDKRLAMAVEDHPYDYRTFEGTIPEGNYGAGTVIVWDEGTFTLEGLEEADKTTVEHAFRKALKAGKVKLVIHGTKLNGIFTLVQKPGKYDEEGNSWLLIKHQDAYAIDGDIREQDRSVRSERSLDDIAKGTLPPIDQAAIEDAPKASLPKKLKPMLATLVDTPFDRDGWVFEIKWDGYRAVTTIQDGKVDMISRNGTSFNEKFAPIAKALADFPHTAILDGEVVALDDEGKPNFGMLQDSERQQDRLYYYVFDLLYLDGHDLQELPLIRRKVILKDILPELVHIRYCDHIEKAGTAFFELACSQGLEGVIAKDGQSPYRLGARSSAWLKVKSHRRQEAVIAGYTEPRGSRKHIGALILGMYDTHGTLIYVGHTGTGLDSVKLKTLKERLDAISTEKSPFALKVKTNAPVHWTQPSLVCEVKFQEWTGDGHLRQPVLLGLREDKPAKSVMREEAQATGKALKAEKAESKPPAKRGKAAHINPKSAESGAFKVTITHPDKCFWPELGLTKGDVAAYYQEIAPIILPYLKDRPINLHRFPDGVTGQGFYQKDNPGRLPEFVESVTIFSDSNDRELRYISCQNVETLLYLVNLGSFEMNPWNVRIGQLEKPDYVILDLDPLDIGFDQVINAALTIKALLDSAKIPGYCKTSGATGLHIYIPLAARYAEETVKDFANLLAMLVQKKLPETTSIERSPAKRKGKIYLDYLQNRFGQTLACAYSVRPNAFAGVSTPLSWEEVTSKLKPEQFTLQNARKRLDKIGDLWKPVLGKGIDLKKALAALEAI